ncbi:MAG: hypothetical protein QOK39_450, partial [Acidimicrobiaceae bacterium]|nr:hypothetical protein [Acidimicrobiaceae bacterium]
VIDHEGRLLAVYEAASGGRVKPTVVLATADDAAAPR